MQNHKNAKTQQYKSTTTQKYKKITPKSELCAYVGLWPIANLFKCLTEDFLTEPKDDQLTPFFSQAATVFALNRIAPWSFKAALHHCKTVNAATMPVNRIKSKSISFYIGY